MVTSECTGFSGTLHFGLSLISEASYKVTVTNNSFSSATINFSSGDLVLSGITGLTVGTPTFSGGSVSGSNVTLTVWADSCYKLSYYGYSEPMVPLRVSGQSFPFLVRVAK
ncbi:hypothetical protein MTQ00_00025 [Chryseobacterium sp. B21-037]|uniref:hypothetical protein n=1 Tax=Chryseobacterium sp. B21-037 TaxID=2926038 RepID=UPI0023590E00|nr:hypothetical protein [Chryseobacterium sp. B21-037]MDC8102915.1 hypothetical protein [Chryseobacterium sp. B21-037]